MTRRPYINDILFLSFHSNRWHRRLNAFADPISKRCAAGWRLICGEHPSLPTRGRVCGANSRNTWLWIFSCTWAHACLLAWEFIWTDSRNPRLSILTRTWTNSCLGALTHFWAYSRNSRFIASKHRLIVSLLRILRPHWRDWWTGPFSSSLVIASSNLTGLNVIPLLLNLSFLNLKLIWWLLLKASLSLLCSLNESLQDFHGVRSCSLDFAHLLLLLFGLVG